MSVIPTIEEIRQGLDVLEKFEKRQAENPDLAEWEINQILADDLRIGEFGVEWLLSVGRTERDMEEARVKHLDNRK